jgi:hypothetical protein
VPRRHLPRIYCDVHIKPGAIEGFRKQRFTCVRIPESKYRDLDEHDFYPHLYAENALLATGDLNFVEDAIENNFRHAGIIVSSQNGTTKKRKRMLSYWRNLSQAILRLKVNTPGGDALSTFIMMGLLLITTQKKKTSIHGSRCNKLLIVGAGRNW